MSFSKAITPESSPFQNMSPDSLNQQMELLAKSKSLMVDRTGTFKEIGFFKSALVKFISYFTGNDPTNKNLIKYQAMHLLKHAVESNYYNENNIDRIDSIAQNLGVKQNTTSNRSHDQLDLLVVEIKKHVLEKQECKAQDFVTAFYQERHAEMSPKFLGLWKWSHEPLKKPEEVKAEPREEAPMSALEIPLMTPDLVETPVEVVIEEPIATPRGIIEVPSTTTMEPENSVDQQAINQQTVDAQNNSEPKPQEVPAQEKRNYRNWIIAGVAGAIIIGTGYLLYRYLGTSEEMTGTGLIPHPDFPPVPPTKIDPSQMCLLNNDVQKSIVEKCSAKSCYSGNPPLGIEPLTIGSYNPETQSATESLAKVLGFAKEQTYPLDTCPPDDLISIAREAKIEETVKAFNAIGFDASKIIKLEEIDPAPEPIVSSQGICYPNGTHYPHMQQDFASRFTDRTNLASQTIDLSQPAEFEFPCDPGAFTANPLANRDFIYQAIAKKNVAELTIEDLQKEFGIGPDLGCQDARDFYIDFNQLQNIVEKYYTNMGKSKEEIFKAVTHIRHIAREYTRLRQPFSEQFVLYARDMIVYPWKQISQGKYSDAIKTFFNWGQLTDDQFLALKKGNYEEAIKSARNINQAFNECKANAGWLGADSRFVATEWAARQVVPPLAIGGGALYGGKKFYDFAKNRLTAKPVVVPPINNNPLVAGNTPSVTGKNARKKRMRKAG